MVAGIVEADVLRDERALAALLFLASCSKSFVQLIGKVIVNCLWIVAVWLLIVSGLARIVLDRRDALLGGSAVFGLIVLVITEGLSAVHCFYFQPAVVSWILATCCAGIFFFLIRRRTAGVGESFSPSTDIWVRLCIGFVLVIAALVGITAVVSPPNNWDSMTYHMARVCNWIQNHSVSFYPTGILRQLYLGPSAEYAVANLQILVGSDRLANVVQVCAMLGCVVGVSSIAGKLGVSPRGQAVAGLFAASIPIMILEASSTQTDCVAAFWVVCAVNFALLAKQNPKGSWFTGIAIGLAFLTKATTALFLAPLMIWIAVDIARGRSWKDFGRFITLAAVLPLVMNATHLYRNYRVFGDVLVPRSEAGWYRNELHTPSAISSNVMRNLLVNTGFRWMGRYPIVAARLVRSVSGLDPSDPRITYPATHFKLLYTRDEDDAGNPIHLLIGLAAIIITIYAGRRAPVMAMYAGCVVIAFLIFCFELKWQPWITRLQLPLFVLLAPLVGMMVDRIRITAITGLLISLLFAQSFIYLLYGMPRTMIGPRSIFSVSRADQYFSKRPDLRPAYQHAAGIVARFHPRRVALVSKGDSWEYAIRSQLPAGTSIVHVGIENPSKNCPPYDSADRPQVLIQLDNAPVPKEFSAYRIADEQTGIAVLIEVPIKSRARRAPPK